MPENLSNLHSYSFDNTESDLYDFEYQNVVKQITEKYKNLVEVGEFNITHINFSLRKCKVWIKKLNLDEEFAF